jgi:endonuclease-3 related protein
VEQAMGNLNAAGVLSVSRIREISLDELEHLLRPAGYFRQKAARLKGFVAHLDANYGGSLDALLARPLGPLREELLRLAGVGPETADSILLYAGNREVFVVDTYTRRILERHGLARPGTGYEEIRASVETALSQTETAARIPTDTPLPNLLTPLKIHAPSAVSAARRSERAQRYNEFHALLVQTAKHNCAKASPLCDTCPLRTLLPTGGRPGEVDCPKLPSNSEDSSRQDNRRTRSPEKRRRNDSRSSAACDLRDFVSFLH